MDPADGRTVTLPPAAAGPRTPGAVFPPAGVRMVVCDVVGTLVEPWPPVARAYVSAGRRHGIELPEAEVAARFAAAWKRQESLDAAASLPFATSPGRERGRWRAIVGDVFGDSVAAGPIFADLWEHFARPEAWRGLPAGTALVAAATAAGLPVALASNFDERLHGLAAALAPLDRARHVFTSAELGWRKPAPEFFRAIERRLGLSPAALLLVGDDPDLDVAAARRAGWHALPTA